MDTCRGCDGPLPTKHKQRLFCSKACRIQHQKKKYREANPVELMLPASTVGAMHELVVAVDLMKRRYSVFRAMSPNSPCDLAVLRSGILLNIEVTTGCRTSTGLLTYPPHRSPAAHFDVIAVVEKDGKITYIPEIV